jgi:plastocyanin
MTPLARFPGTRPRAKALIIAGTGLAVLAPLAVGAAVTDIDQLGIRFAVDAVTVAAGDIIRYHNRDDVTHNLHVIDQAGDDEDEGLQKSQVVVEKKFDKAGSFVVRCSIHPRMKMTVKVE